MSERRLEAGCGPVWATVTFNGIRTVEGARNADFAHGRIALRYGLGLVKFRKVQVRTI